MSSSPPPIIIHTYHTRPTLFQGMVREEFMEDVVKRDVRPPMDKKVRVVCGDVNPLRSVDVYCDLDRPSHLPACLSACPSWVFRSGRKSSKCCSRRAGTPSHSAARRSTSWRSSCGGWRRNTQSSRNEP
jgi:hypothetical protein